MDRRSVFETVATTDDEPCAPDPVLDLFQRTCGPFLVRKLEHSVGRLQGPLSQQRRTHQIARRNAYHPRMRQPQSRQSCHHQSLRSHLHF